MHIKVRKVESYFNWLNYIKHEEYKIRFENAETICFKY